MARQSYIGPREKLLLQPISALSDHELIQAIIGSGSRGVSLRMIARKVLKLVKARTLDLANLQQIPGLGAAGAAKMLACFELAGRYHPEATAKAVDPVAKAAAMSRLAMRDTSLTILLVTASREGRYRDHHTVPIYQSDHSLSVQYCMRRALQDSASSLYIARFKDNLEVEDNDIKLCRTLYSAALMLGMRLTSYQLVNQEESKELV